MNYSNEGMWRRGLCEYDLPQGAKDGSILTLAADRAQTLRKRRSTPTQQVNLSQSRVLVMIIYVTEALLEQALRMRKTGMRGGIQRGRASGFYSSSDWCPVRTFALLI